jgi:hypothetical protein
MLEQAIYEQVGASCGGRENAGAGVPVNGCSRMLIETRG